MESAASLSPCPGCGIITAQLEGTPHPYIGASQGCWNIYGQALNRLYTEFQSKDLVHRLVVDAYAVQHPGVPERRAIQSVNVHLISLWYIFEKGYDAPKATQKMSEALSQNLKFNWLQPPEPNGKITVQDLVRTIERHDFERTAQEWAADLWSHWSARHGTTIRDVVRKIGE